MKNIPLFLLVLLTINTRYCLGQGEVFTKVDSPPEFPGGVKAFYQYVKENLIYPEIAQESLLEGNVFVQFVVEKDGNLTEIQTIKGIGEQYNAEAEKVLQNAPSFTPGYQDGKPVRVRTILPITFLLKKENGNSPVVRPKETYVPPASSLQTVITNPNIKELILKSQGLTTLDIQIAEATQLIHLDLTGNKLKEIPEEIGALKDLKVLYLTYNQLEHLPAAFFKLQSLETLYLDRNDFHEFPIQLLELSQLETIDISYTKINQLPLQIAEMPHLKIIYARGTVIPNHQINQLRELNPALEILK